MPKAKAKKPQNEIHIKCPWGGCGKKIDVEVYRDIVTPSKPAETKIRVVVKKDGQKTLFDEPSKGSKGTRVKTRKAVKGKAPKKKKGSKK